MSVKKAAEIEINKEKMKSLA